MRHHYRQPRTYGGIVRPLAARSLGHWGAGLNLYSTASVYYVLWVWSLRPQGMSPTLLPVLTPFRRPPSDLHTHSTCRRPGRRHIYPLSGDNLPIRADFLPYRHPSRPRPRDLPSRANPRRPLVTVSLSRCSSDMAHRRRCAERLSPLTFLGSLCLFGPKLRVKIRFLQRRVRTR